MFRVTERSKRTDDPRQRCKRRSAAGLQVGWLNRRNAIDPDLVETPDATGETLTTLVEVLLSSA